MFLQLFNRSLGSFVIFNAGWSFEPSIQLSPECACSLLSGCKMIASNPRLKERFQSIIILKPKDPISGFIEKQQSDFQAIGWRLEEKEYTHPRRGLCPEALHICLL